MAEPETKTLNRKLQACASTRIAARCVSLWLAVQLGIAIAICLLLAQTGSASDEKTPKPTDLRQSVRQFIEQLDAPTLGDRKRAESSLVDLGPDALPLLPAAELLPSIGSQKAVQRIRVRLEHEAARRSIVPSHISLRGEFTTSELMELIERETSNRIAIAPDVRKKNARLKVDWTSRPFWDAVEDLRQFGVEVRFVPERTEFELRTITSQSQSELVVADGPFRMRFGPTSVTATADKDEGLWRVPITLAAEPRLRPLFLRYAAQDFQVSGSENKPLHPFDAEARWEVPLGDGGRESRIELRFVGPANAKSLKSVRLTGGMTLLLAAAEVPIEFSQWAKSRGVARRRGGVTVTLAEVTAKTTPQKKLSATLQTHVSYDGRAQAFESHQTWILHNKVYLLTPEGQQIAPNGGSEMLFQNGTTVGVEYRFEDLPPEATGWRFVYLAPTLLIDVPVKFEGKVVPVVNAE